MGRLGVEGRRLVGWCLWDGMEMDYAMVVLVALVLYHWGDTFAIALESLLPSWRLIYPRFICFFES